MEKPVCRGLGTDPVAGDLKPLRPWPQAAWFLIEAAPSLPPAEHARLPGQVPAAGVQRAFVLGGHHPLAGPSPLTEQPLPAGLPPFCQQLRLLLLQRGLRPRLLPDGAAQELHCPGATSRLPSPRLTGADH